LTAAAAAQLIIDAAGLVALRRDNMQAARLDNLIMLAPDLLAKLL
jgi:hypothetical protein